MASARRTWRPRRAACRTYLLDDLPAPTDSEEKEEEEEEEEEEGPPAAAAPPASPAPLPPPPRRGAVAAAARRVISAPTPAAGLVVLRHREPQGVHAPEHAPAELSRLRPPPLLQPRRRRRRRRHRLTCGPSPPARFFAGSWWRRLRPPARRPGLDLLALDAKHVRHGVHSLIWSRIFLGLKNRKSCVIPDSKIRTMYY